MPFDIPLQKYFLLSSFLLCFSGGNYALNNVVGTLAIHVVTISNSSNLRFTPASTTCKWAGYLNRRPKTSRSLNKPISINFKLRPQLSATSTQTACTSSAQARPFMYRCMYVSIELQCTYTYVFLCNLWSCCNGSTNSKNVLLFQIL